MSSVNKILESHGKTPKDPKETRALAEQMHGDLVHEGTVAPATPATPAKRGRPKGSTSKSPSVARRRTSQPEIELGQQMPVPPPPGQQRVDPDSPEAVAERMKCRRAIRKLRAYKRNFPELLAADLETVNVHACTYAQLLQLIDSCKEVIGDEVESMTCPDIMGSLLDSVESTAMQVAMSAGPEAGARNLLLLKNFADRAKADPCIAMDLKLIGCDLIGLIPQNPYLRLAVNLLKCGSSLYKRNQNEVMQMHAGAPVAERFDEF